MHVWLRLGIGTSLDYTHMYFVVSILPFRWPILTQRTVEDNGGIFEGKKFFEVASRRTGFVVRVFAARRTLCSSMIIANGKG
jgi:hypothetical protein